MYPPLVVTVPPVALIPPRPCHTVPLYTSNLFNVELNLIIPATPVGCSPVVPLGTVKAPVPENVAFPLTVNSPPTSTFPLATKEVVGFVNSTVCGVILPFVVVFSRLCVVAITSTVPMVNVPPMCKLDEVVSPVSTFVKFVVVVTLDAIGANSTAPIFITSAWTFPDTFKCALLILRNEFSFVK